MRPSDTYKSGDQQKALADVLDTFTMKRAIEVAFMETVLRLPPVTDIQGGAMNAAKIEGAKLFMRTLLSLAQPESQRATLPPLHLTD